MTNNWQQPDWPNFRYDLSFVEDLLFDFAEKTGHIAGLLQGLPDNAQQEIILSLMVSEAVKTSEIEGEFIQRSDVMSSIRNNLGLSPAHEEVGDKKAQGVGELMVAVRQSFAAPLTETMLFDWHSRLMAPFVKRLIVGQWRSHEDPMQIVSGPLGKQRVHFEAPSSSDVPKEMAGFIYWFNDTAPGGNNSLKSPAVRSAIAHLYFESIHPFEDGNGRIGRALSEKALSQGLGRPVVMSLSKAIESNRKAYYGALSDAQTSNDLTEWIAYFTRTILDAQNDTEQTINAALFKTKIFDRYRGKLNDRQMSIISFMLENSQDESTHMRTKTYMKMTGASKATTARDLQNLVELGIFRQAGEGRNTHYEVEVI